MRNLRRLKLIMSSLLFLMMLLGSVQTVQAAGTGFTVKANLPSNQYNPEASYFDVLMKPGTKQTFIVTIKNLENQSKTIKAEANTGYTTDSGQESMNKHELGALSTAPYQFNQIFGASQKVTLKPNEMKQVTFTAKMPANGYSGILEGAFYFEDLATGQAQSTNQTGFSIKNKFAMAIGVILRESTTEHAQPKLQLQKIKLSQTDQSNPAILAQLMNDRPATVGQLTIDAIVTKKGQPNKVLFRQKQTNRSMAANSHFNYHIPVGNQWLNPGQYQVHLVASNSQYRWTFNQKFTISLKQATEINRHNQHFNWLWWLLLAIIIVGLLLGLTYYLGTRKRSKKED